MKPLLLSLAALACLAAAARPAAADPLPASPSAEAPAERPAGKFVWSELLTSGEPARSAPFYEQVFGWRSEITGKSYAARVVFFLHDRPVAGIAHRPAERAGPPRARWLGFFAVPDVSAAVAQATQAGGKVLVPAAAWPGRGEQAIIADPEGAGLGLLSASAGESEEYAAESGEWIWPVLFARRPDETAGFYHTLLNLEVKPERRTPLFGGDFVLAHGLRARAGLMALPRDTTGRPGWLGFIRVADLDATVEAVRKHDGHVVQPPSPDLIGGRVAVAADPQGGVFGLVQLSPTAGPVAKPVIPEIAAP